MHAVDWLYDADNNILEVEFGANYASYDAPASNWVVTTNSGDLVGTSVEVSINPARIYVHLPDGDPLGISWICNDPDALHFTTPGEWVAPFGGSLL